MKHVLTTIFSTGLFVNICFADENFELKELKTRESCSLGDQLR